MVWSDLLRLEQEVGFLSSPMGIKNTTTAAAHWYEWQTAARMMQNIKISPLFGLFYGRVVVGKFLRSNREHGHAHECERPLSQQG